MRTRQRATMAAMAALVAVGGLAPSTGPARAAEPAAPTLVVVDPTTDLVEGQLLHVQGGGYEATPGEWAYLQVCRDVPAPDPVADCTTGTEDPADPLRSSGTMADPSDLGDVWGWVAVARHIQLPEGWVDCGRVACTMALVQPDHGLVSNRVPISFATADRGRWDTAEDVVDELLAPILRQPVGDDQRAGLVDALADGDANLPELVHAAARDHAVDWTVGEAVRQYHATFGRNPDPWGLDYWVFRLEHGLTVDGMARLFAGSAEGRATYAGLDTEAIVERVYALALHRAPDPSGAAYWAGRLEAGLPLWKLVSHVSRSAELRTATAEGVATAALMLGLGSPPQPDQWSRDATYWTVLAMRGG